MRTNVINKSCKEVVFTYISTMTLYLQLLDSQGVMLHSQHGQTNLDVAETFQNISCQTC